MSDKQSIRQTIAVAVLLLAVAVVVVFGFQEEFGRGGGVSTGRSGGTVIIPVGFLIALVLAAMGAFSSKPESRRRKEKPTAPYSIPLGQRPWAEGSFGPEHWKVHIENERRMAAFHAARKAKPAPKPAAAAARADGASVRDAADREFQNVFFNMSAADKERFITSVMRRKACGRDEAMRIAVAEWREEQRWT
jgi:hypothetical protein